MDKIYCRRKIKFPSFANKKNQRIYKFIAIWTIAIFTAIYIFKSINPVFEELCKKQAESMATLILNDESSKVIRDINYDELIISTKDSNGNIIMVKSNVILINLLASDIAYNIQEKFNSIENNTIKMPLGSLTGSKLFAGFGPNVNIKILSRGTVVTTFKSTFETAGINQTIHRLYLDVECEVSVITAYSSINTKVLNQVLFAENIIVGAVPSSYYNLEGIDRTDAMEVIE